MNRQLRDVAERAEHVAAQIAHLVGIGDERAEEQHAAERERTRRGGGGGRARAQKPLQPDAAGCDGAPTQQQARDEEPGQREERADAEEAAPRTRHLGVEQDDRDHGEAAQSVERGTRVHVPVPPVNARIGFIRLASPPRRLWPGPVRDRGTGRAGRPDRAVDRPQVVVEHVHERFAGREVQVDDLLRRHVLEMLHEAAQRIAVRGDEHGRARAQVGDDAVVPPRQHRVRARPSRHSERGSTSRGRSA